MSDSFDSSLTQWLGDVLPDTAPQGVVAFSFNITESKNWLVELIGASSYKADDADWACPPEAWSSAPSRLAISRSIAGDSWESAQCFIVERVRYFLQNSESAQASILRSATAVCVGFVDGDLNQVWPSDEA